MIKRVLIEAEATPEQTAAVAAVFDRAGIPAPVVAGMERKSHDQLPWIVHVTLEVPIEAFFTAMGATAGAMAMKDAYGPIKEWLRDLIAARRGSGSGEGSTRLDDPEGTNLIVPAAIPDEALDALADIDWSEMRGGYLLWDAEAQEWRDKFQRRRG